MLTITVTSASQIVNINKRIPRQNLILKSYRLEMDSFGAAFNRKVIYASLPFLSDNYILDENPQATTLQLFTGAAVWNRTTNIPIAMSSDINNLIDVRLYEGPIYTGSAFEALTNFVSLTLVFQLTGELIEEQNKLSGVLTLRMHQNDRRMYISNKIERQILYMTGYRVEMLNDATSVSEKIVYVDLPFCNNQEHLIDGNGTRFMIPLLLGSSRITDVQNLSIPIYADDIPDTFQMKLYDKTFALSTFEDLIIQFKFERDIT